jgi:alpha-D-xyloside xylohydrolase
MMNAKRMPLRGPILKEWRLENHILYLATVRHSSEEDVEGAISLTPVNGEVVRIAMTEGKALQEAGSLCVTESSPAHEIETSVQDRGDHLEFRTGSIAIEIRKQGCAFTYLTAAGEPLLREWGEGGKWLKRIDVMAPVRDAGGDVVVDHSVDGVKVRAANRKLEKNRDGFAANLYFELDDGEAVYGLGQHEEGILNYRGHYQFLYQENMKVAMPVMVSSKGYALFWDTLALSTFDDTNGLTTISIDVCDQLEFYFVYGPEFDEIASHLRALTGPMPMLPKWSYGYLQSKERYQTATELEEVVRTYREHNVPLDCIILDWRSWEGEQWGQKTFDRSRFPDPSAMMDALHAMNSRMMISIWPIMREGGANHAEMLEKGFMLGNQSTYDAYNPAALETYWRQAEEGLFTHGVDGWWCDCTEPFEADWGGEMKLTAFQRMQINVEESKKYLDPALINGYSLAHSRGLYEGQRGSGSSKRMINLTRSGSMGQHRYGTVTWSGDIEARWSRLRKQIADGLNFTITGNPRWTFDIGAFFTKPAVPWFWDGQYPDGNQDPGYRELYVRWLQTGAFLPMFRSHGTDTCREIWNFGDPGTPFYDAIKKGIELRYRLMPYIYSLAGWEVHRGYTMFRNLAFDFRHDPKVHRIADQFMFGPALMVCPVLEPMHYGPGGTPLAGVEQSRMVYLPEDRDWYDFHTGERYAGGQTIEAAAPLDRIPLFVPAGSIIPTGPVTQYVDEQSDAPWDILVYPGQDARFDIYEDSGDGYGYEQGECAWRTLAWDDASRTLSNGPVSGTFPRQVKHRKLNTAII